MNPRSERKPVVLPFHTARTLARMKAGERLEVLLAELDALEAWLADLRSREEALDVELRAWAPPQAMAPVRRLRAVAPASICRTERAD